MDNVQRISTNINKYNQHSTHIIANISKYQSIISNITTTINTYRQISTNISKCKQLSTTINKYIKIQTNAITYQHILKNITSYQLIGTNYRKTTANIWAGSMPLALWSPHVSCMLCANYAQTDRSMARLACRSLCRKGRSLASTYECQWISTNINKYETNQHISSNIN